MKVGLIAASATLCVLSGMQHPRSLRYLFIFLVVTCGCLMWLSRGAVSLSLMGPAGRWAKDTEHCALLSDVNIVHWEMNTQT